MIDTEHTIADKLLEDFNEEKNPDERDRLLTQYQRICLASKDRAESDLFTFEIVELLERDEKK